MSTAAVFLVMAALALAPPESAAAPPSELAAPDAAENDEVANAADTAGADELDDVPERAEPTESPSEAALADDSAPAVKPAAQEDEILTVAEGSGREGPPFYTASDEAKLRERYGLEVDPPEDVPPARWRCLIADPTCGISFEINATSAYAYRMRQGGVRDISSHGWHSARVQYDLWLNLPVLVETSGNQRFSRITMGPKGGVVFSDSGDLWGNIGLATRYWLGRGRWAPTIEFTSALTFRMGSRPERLVHDAQGQPIEPEFRMTRGPAGFAADIGFGFGGFGAIVVGGQYDSPFAREDVPEIFRTPAAGMFFVGFRGNILWGGPAGAAVLTHVLAQRHAGPRI